MSEDVSQREVDWSAFRELVVDVTPPTAAGAAPRRPLLIGAVACWLGCFALIGTTWSGVSDRAVVALQMPIMVSGGLATITLAIIGAALFIAGAGNR